MIIVDPMAYLQANIAPENHNQNICLYYDLENANFDLLCGGVNVNQGITVHIFWMTPYPKLIEM